jgi:uncharacterized protein YcbK (DUF882 family)
LSSFSPHISVEEYRCRCCGCLPPSWNGDEPAEAHKRLFSAFEDIRYEWGKPIIINSGYRCMKHNQAVAGEPCSIHLFGLALDITAIDPAENDVLWQVIIARHPELRLGRYTRKNDFIHMDVGYLIYPIALPEWHTGARWTG